MRTDTNSTPHAPVKVTVEGEAVWLAAPYEPSMPAKAGAIGGRWKGEAQRWQFDLRDEERVRELAREVYGTDGTPGPVVTVRLDVSTHRMFHGASLWLFGRQIAHRAERDARVRLGDGVIVVAGGFPSGGGSRNNPALDPTAGTVLEVRDVPASHADLTARGVTVMGADDMIDQEG